MISCTVDPLLAQHLRQAPGITLTTKAIHLDPNKYAYMAEGTMGLVFVVHWLKISIKCHLTQAYLWQVALERDYELHLPGSFAGDL